MVNYPPIKARTPTLTVTLAELWEHFQQLQEYLTKLEPTTNPPVHAEEFAQLSNKLQQLTVTLQPHPTPRHMEESLHPTMQKYTNTLCVTQWQTNITMSCLQDISTFDRWDTTNLEDWITDI